MPAKICSHRLLVTWCLLVCVCLTESAPRKLSSSADVTSGSTAAKERLTRSVPLSTRPEEAQSKDDCTADFVENVFRVLSGSVGKEAEAVVAAVLELLSEDDRINWPSMADQSVQTTPARARLVPGKPGIYRQSPVMLSSKRMSPKFNPTGWRRKRDASSSPWLGALQRLLRQYDEAAVATETDDKPSAMYETDDVRGDRMADGGEWVTEKRTLGSRFRRLRAQGKPKRKPLEFNPTGW